MLFILGLGTFFVVSSSVARAACDAEREAWIANATDEMREFTLPRLAEAAGDLNKEHRVASVEFINELVRVENIHPVPKPVAVRFLAAKAWHHCLVEAATKADRIKSSVENFLSVVPPEREERAVALAKEAL